MELNLKADERNDMENLSNPYDSFIRKHLQYYGYNNSSLQNPVLPKKLKQYHYNLSVLWGQNAQSTSSQKTDNRSQLENEYIQEYHVDSFKEESFWKFIELYNDSLSDSEDCSKESNLQTTQLTYSEESGNKIPILKKPRNLYVLPSDLGINAGVRWPIELQVLPHQIRHILSYPVFSEAFSSVPSIIELQVQPNPQSKKDKVVFSYPIVVGNSFVRSYIAGVNTIEENFAHRTTHHSTLTFESRFESGNLCKAIQIEDCSYELYIRPDLYAPHQAQWFYFQVKNMCTSEVYKFSIVNLSKPSNLYCCGMKPLMYSERYSEEKGIGWFRVGDHVSHTKNSDCEDGMYTLTWSQKFPYENDTVYFAYSYPYTYSYLQEYLADIMNDPIKIQYCHIRVLCRTLAGNNVYIVTVTSPENLPSKKVIVLTARVHPGESVSSWVMKGFLDFITGHTEVAQNLRRNFIFKIVPMLNPDGVIIGNHRCSLSGSDLNRSYRTMFKETFPPSWHVRRMIRKLLDEYEVAMYCDIHGHGQLQNMFMYGCENPMSSPNYLVEQLFPLLLHRRAPDLFSFQQCRFNIQKSREGTGRVVMWMMGIPLSYTLEVSFAGSSTGEKAGTHFTPLDYEQIAHHFCHVLVEYFDQRKSKHLWLSSLLQQLRANGSTALEPVIPKLIEDFNLSDNSSDCSFNEELLANLFIVDTETKSENDQTTVKSSKSTENKNGQHSKQMQKSKGKTQVTKERTHTASRKSSPKRKKTVQQKSEGTVDKSIISKKKIVLRRSSCSDIVKDSCHGTKARETNKGPSAGSVISQKKKNTRRQSCT